MQNALYKVAGYLRLSREDGDKEESDSIGSQRSIIIRKLEELGQDFELIDFYIDDGYTGLNTDRPAFRKMLEDIKKGLINTIITKDLSRLSRNSFESNYFIEKYFLENNIRYISILDNVDTYIKNSNNDMIQFKTLINDWYSKDISKKVRSGIWARKEKGLYLAAMAPYGYVKDSKDKNHLIIEPERAVVVKRIFNMFDNGVSMTEIANKLKNEKVYCPGYYDYGGSRSGDDYKWRADSIKRILKSQVYIGNTEYGKKVNLSYKSKKVKNIPREDWKISLNTHEAIIDKETFDRVQAKLNLNKKVRRKKFNWMLNGLVFCKECGNKMVLKIKRDKNGSITSKIIVCASSMNTRKNDECERRSKSIKEEVLKKIVVESVNKKINHIIKNQKLEEIIMREYKNKTTAVLDKAIKSIEDKLSKTEKAINSLYEDYTNGIIEEEDYRRFYKGEVERRNTLKLEINNLLKQKAEKPTITKEELITIISKLSNIGEWTSEKLSELIYNIEIDKQNNIYINYRYDVIGKL